jgi:glycosyltransferase involved in cell wall biosynthesis
MKILQIHNFYKTPGGECSVVHAERQLLESHGHEVALFSRNSAEIDELSMMRKVPVLLQIPYNYQIKRELSRLLKKDRPDVAHVHNVFPLLSPSIYDALKNSNIPVVQTVHNFRFLCPNGQFFIRGNICEKCQTDGFFSAVKHRCMHDSVPVSALYAMAIGNAWRTGNFPSNIDRFIALNRFVADKLTKAGIPKNKISILGNFIENVSDDPVPKKKYILYLGRLSREKGLWTLLSAMRNVRDVVLKIAGTGPLEHELMEDVKRHDIKNVEFVGFVTGHDKERLIREAICSVVPSEWYENYPVSVLESLASGTPVIASNIGGLPEMIEHKKTGFLFKPGSHDELSKYIEISVNNPILLNQMATQAIISARSNFGAELHYHKLVSTYEEVVLARMGTPQHDSQK